MLCQSYQITLINRVNLITNDIIDMPGYLIEHKNTLNLHKAITSTLKIDLLITTKPSQIKFKHPDFELSNDKQIHCIEERVLSFF